MPGKGPELHAGLFDYIENKLEDGGEVIKHSMDLYALNNTKKYFEKKKAEIEDIDPMEVFDDPEKITDLVKEVNGEIVKAETAARSISTSNLKFSRAFLGPVVEELETALNDLNDWTIGILEMAVDPESTIGEAIRFFTSDETDAELKKLDIEVKLLKKNTTQFKGTLEGLILEGLTTPTNNDFVNGGLGLNADWESLMDFLSIIGKSDSKEKTKKA